MKQILALLICIGFLNCGLSNSEMETAKNHFMKVAESECKCKKMKPEEDGYSLCVEEHSRNVRYMTSFFEVVKPSDSEKKKASVEAEAIRANCK